MATTIEAVREQVFKVVLSIPHGQVTTYGQVASLAGVPNQPRLVGKILSRLPQDTRLPWHRVINSQGRISNPDPHRQQARLEREGVTLVNGRVSLKHYGWQP
ncbi:MAG: MGMT family protein [Pseudomonadales bacterium]